LQAVGTTDLSIAKIGVKNRSQIQISPDFSAVSIAMGCASVLASQGSFSAVCAGAISGVGNASLPTPAR
jgi:hypothetical protein